MPAHWKSARLHVELGGGEVGDGHDVERVHSPGDGAAILDVPLFKDRHLEAGVDLQGSVRRQATPAPSAYDQDIGLDFSNFHNPFFLDSLV